MVIDAHTSLYCVFGNPVRHTLSPAMHNAAFAAERINAVYLAFEIGSIAAAVSSMRALPIMGASVTIPYKVDVMEWIDEIDPLARSIGSVNTLCNRAGIITGYNTDGAGAVRALERSGVEIRGASALVIGNGGSARAVSHALAAGGARVTICGRNRERILALADSLKSSGHAAGAVTIADLNESIMKEVDIIVNTTPVGMGADSRSVPIDSGLLKPAHSVFDIVYSPDRTAFLEKAEEAGCLTVRGSRMLLCQGALQFELWTGRKAPYDIMLEILSERLGPDDR